MGSTGLGLGEDPGQRCQRGAQGGVQLRETAGELVGAVGEFGQVILMGVSLGDRAGHLVTDLAVLPRQLSLVQACARGPGDTGDLGDTRQLRDPRRHFIQVGQGLAGAHISGRFNQHEFGDDDVLAKVAVQQVIPLIAGGGRRLSLAIVVADVHSQRDGRQA